MCVLALIGLLVMVFYRRNRPLMGRVDRHPVIVQVQQGSHDPSWPSTVPRDTADSPILEHLCAASSSLTHNPKEP